MNILKNLLFSFEGKIGRADYIYWIVYVALLGFVSLEVFFTPARVRLIGGWYDFAMFAQYLASLFGIALFLWSFFAITIKRLREFHYDVRLSPLALVFPPLLLVGLLPDKSHYKYHNKLALLDHTFFYVLILVVIIAIFWLYRLTLFARFVIFFNAVISVLMLNFFWSDKHRWHNGEHVRYKWYDTWIDLGFVLLIVFFVRSYVLSPFQIIGPSMENTFHGGAITYGNGGQQKYSDGEFILVDKMSYRFSNPIRGDVVVFTPGIGPEKRYLIKRIIGVAWDTVKIENGYTYLATAARPGIFIKLDESPYLQEKFGKTCLNYSGVGCDNESRLFTVPKGHFFLMGDNRPQSLDARKCFSNSGCIGDYRTAQFVPMSQIQWRVAYSLGHFDLMKQILPYPIIGTLKQVIPFRGKDIQNTHTYSELK